MEVLKWLLPVGLSFLFGLLYVQFLTVHPLRMSRYLFGSTLAFAGVVAALLLEFRATVALAESCTGGLIGKMLTDIPGSSAFLDRSAVTYSNQSKSDWLGVPGVLLESEDE